MGVEELRRVIEDRHRMCESDHPRVVPAVAYIAMSGSTSASNGVDGCLPCTLGLVREMIADQEAIEIVPIGVQTPHPSIPASRVARPHRSRRRKR